MLVRDALHRCRDGPPCMMHRRHMHLPAAPYTMSQLKNAAAAIDPEVGPTCSCMHAAQWGAHGVQALYRL